jgi:hypothetical protein
MSMPTPESLRAMAAQLTGKGRLFEKAHDALLTAADELDKAPRGLQPHFMYDCHLFAAVSGDTDAALIARIRELFIEDGCGSLFVRDRFDRSVNELDLHGKPLVNGKYGVTDAQIADWVKRFRLAEGKEASK